MMAVVAEGNNGRIYLSPDNKQISEARVTLIGDYVHGAMPENPRWFSPPAFGLKDFEMLFTNRQLAALTTFSDLVEKAQQKVEADAIAAGLPDVHPPSAIGARRGYFSCNNTNSVLDMFKKLCYNDHRWGR